MCAAEPVNYRDGSARLAEQDGHGFLWHNSAFALVEVESGLTNDLESNGTGVFRNSVTVDINGYGLRA